MSNVSQLSRALARTKASALVCVLAVIPAAAQSFYPLSDVRPGLKGTGRTVFSGNRIEDFQVEILGILENLTPKQSIILARLSGGPLAETGVLQGMSGSPVYVDGRLLGAIALGFPFSKEPIAGIQPISQMLGVPETGSPSAPIRLAAGDLQRVPLVAPARVWSRNTTPSIGNLQEIFTPLGLSGFSERAVQAFSGEFHRLGLEPQQGVGAGSAKSQLQGSGNPPGTVLPGSMISVQLLTGDMSISADGTVTYVDGKRVYAFGHRFLDSGSTDLPFARADVVALLPTLNSSFKLSAAREWVGSMTEDRSTAISGQIGRPARLIPLEIEVKGPAGDQHRYRMQVINDRLLTSLITQASLFSTIDATERTLGPGTIRLQGKIEFDGNAPLLEVNDVFVSDTGTAQQASTDAVATLGFVLGSGLPDLRIKRLRYEMESLERKRQLRVMQVWASRHDIHPGESFDINVAMRGENGLEVTRTSSYSVPVGAVAGTLNITASDALSLNSVDFAGLSQTSFSSGRALIEAVNQYRSSDSVYVRVWRQSTVYSVNPPYPGADLTDPPPSVTLILADPSASASAATTAGASRGTTLSETRLSVDYVVNGAKTIQVEIKD